MDKITTIDHKIDRLRKQKTKIQTQEAVLFRHEAEKIFEKNFTPELALAMMSDWTTASDAKKKEWTNKSHSFRTAPLQRAQRKNESLDPTDHQNGKTSSTENG